MKLLHREFLCEKLVKAQNPESVADASGILSNAWRAALP